MSIFTIGNNAFSWRAGNPFKITNFFAHENYSTEGWQREQLGDKHVLEHGKLKTQATCPLSSIFLAGSNLER